MGVLSPHHPGSPPSPCAHPAPRRPLWARPCSAGVWLLLCLVSVDLRPGGLLRAVADIPLLGLGQEAPQEQPGTHTLLEVPQSAAVSVALAHTAPELGGLWGRLPSSQAAGVLPTPPPQPAKGGTVTGGCLCAAGDGTGTPLPGVLGASWASAQRLPWRGVRVHVGSLFSVSVPGRRLQVTALDLARQVCLLAGGLLLVTPFTSSPLGSVRVVTKDRHDSDWPFFPGARLFPSDAPQFRTGRLARAADPQPSSFL